MLQSSVDRMDVELGDFSTAQTLGLSDTPGSSSPEAQQQRDMQVSDLANADSPWNAEGLPGYVEC